MTVSGIPDVALAKATFEEWWTFGTTLFGAVVGSVVGGLISYFLTRQANRETAKREEAARQNNNKSIAFRLIVKTGEIVSSLAALHHQTEDHIASAEKQGIQGPLWSKMLPMVGLEKRINFDPEEIAILLPLKINETINSLFMLDDQHNSIMATMELYSRKRAAFGERFGAFINENNVGTTDFTQEQLQMASPMIAELDALAKSIRAGAKEYFGEAVKIFEALASSLRSHFVDFPVFQVVDYKDAKQQKNG